MKSIVLRRRDLKEVDQIISLYTRDTGKRDLLARGVKKIVSKNTAHLEPCMLVDAEIVPGKDLDLLIKVVPIEIFKPIRIDVKKSLFAQYLAFFIDKTVETGQRDTQLFDMFHEWLVFLSQTAKPHTVLIDAFMLRFFSFTGMQPELARCVSCGREEGFVCFSVANGGMVCDRCVVEKKQIGERLCACDEESRQVLVRLLYGTWEGVSELMSKQKYEDVHHVVYDFVSFHAARPVHDWQKILL